eukprot:1161689-Pelagomonas_calceolata.AAC.1
MADVRDKEKAKVDAERLGNEKRWVWGRMTAHITRVELFPCGSSWMHVGFIDGFTMGLDLQPGQANPPCKGLQGGLAYSPRILLIGYW